MPLHPIESEHAHSSVVNVKVYLDDIRDLIDKLSAFGPVTLEVTHRSLSVDNSVVDNVEDLIERSDVAWLRVYLEDPDDTTLYGPYRPFSAEFRGLNGVSVTIDSKRAELRRIGDHLLATLDKASPPLLYRVRARSGLLFPYVKLVLAFRKDDRESARQRRHSIRLVLLSGVIGLVTGVAATILTVLLSAE